MSALGFTARVDLLLMHFRFLRFTSDGAPPGHFLWVFYLIQKRLIVHRCLRLDRAKMASFLFFCEIKQFEHHTIRRKHPWTNDDFWIRVIFNGTRDPWQTFLLFHDNDRPIRRLWRQWRHHESAREETSLSSQVRVGPWIRYHRLWLKRNINRQFYETNTQSLSDQTCRPHQILYLHRLKNSSSLTGGRRYHTQSPCTPNP